MLIEKELYDKVCEITMTGYEEIIDNPGAKYIFASGYTMISIIEDLMYEIDRLQEGDILVTKFTDTGWTPKFAILSGIVTEYGGVLCHAAIVSREYGIPAIVSATGIMSEIKDGEKITINGTTGEIRKEK